MPDILRTSLSGLVAFQRALAVTANNISNANTDGYSRQRVELAARVPSGFGNGFVGNGVDVATVGRIVDDFAVVQLRANTSQLGSLSSYAEFAGRIDNVLGDPNAGISSGLQAFFNAWQTVANDPASLTNRSLLLQQAQSLADRFRQTSVRLDTLAVDVNDRIGAAVQEINSLAGSIARLNDQITVAQAGANGQPANDLLDARDRLLLQLSRMVDVQTNVESDGAVSVFVGNGQALVLRSQVVGISAVPNAFDPSRIDIAYLGNGGAQTITGALSGGELGGLLQVRSGLLDSARNGLGQVATALAMGVNAQQAYGIDLRGQFGGPIFGIVPPQALASAANTGTGTIAATVADLGQLTTDDYVLRRTATGWAAQVAGSGQAVALTGTGTSADPLRFGGLAVVVAGTAATDDRFLVRPTQAGAGTLTATLNDPRGIAAAAPIRTAIGTANLGTGAISAGQVLDPANPQLQAAVTIRFLTPTSYSINGAGSFAYVPGADIDVNGWRVQLSGAPRIDDTFRVEANSTGLGDNRNALAMAGLQSRGLLAGGTTGVGEAFGTLVGTVGSATRQANLSRDAQAAIASDAQAAQLAISGVNLDEEAADMLRWQQAYGAAAKLVGIADDLFQTLLGTVRR